MALSAMGLNLGVFGFFPTTQAKANAKQMRSWSVHAARILTHVFFMLRPQYMLVTYAPDEPRLFWLREKTRRPPNWAPFRDQNGAGSGISGVYMWTAHKISVVSMSRHRQSRWVRVREKGRVRVRVRVGCRANIFSKLHTRLPCEYPLPYITHVMILWSFLPFQNMVVWAHVIRSITK